MKFIISRTSIFSDFRPCEEAKLEEVSITGYFTHQTLEEAFKNPFFNSEGSFNHRKTPSGTARDTKVKKWVIDCDILDVYDKYGDLCILPSDCTEYPIKIEIYDHYRE